MATRYLEDVARLCRVQVGDLGVEGHYEIPAQSRLVKEFILKAVEPGSDEFMHFMAEWGQECITRDKESGKTLMKMALDRLAKIAYYSEEHGQFDGNSEEMTSECWNFIRNNLWFCLDDCTDEQFEHAEAILLGLLRKLNEDGSTNDGFIWDEEKIGISAKGAYEYLLHISEAALSFYDVTIALAPYWRKNRKYFHFAEGVVNWNIRDIYTAFQNDEAVDNQGNPYFSRRSKFFLKLFGLYQFALILKIRQDMSILPK